MRHLRLFILLAAGLAALPALAETNDLACGAACQEAQRGIYFAQVTPGADTTLTPAVPTVTPSPTVIIPNGSPVPPITQNTVTTTGSVKSETTISVGTLAGQVLQWLAAAFGVPIGGLLAAWLYRLFKLAGVQVADGLRTKLQEIIVNGLNAGAKGASEQLQGKAKIDIKNKVVAQAVAYTQVHGAETIKALGLDPQSGATVEAIKARIETAINDPAAPTPPILDGAGKAAVVA